MITWDLWSGPRQPLCKPQFSNSLYDGLVNTSLNQIFNTRTEMMNMSKRTTCDRRIMSAQGHLGSLMKNRETVTAQAMLELVTKLKDRYKEQLPIYTPATNRKLFEKTKTMNTEARNSLTLVRHKKDSIKIFPPNTSSDKSDHCGKNITLNHT